MSVSEPGEQRWRLPLVQCLILSYSSASFTDNGVSTKSSSFVELEARFNDLEATIRT